MPSTVSAPSRWRGRRSRPFRVCTASPTVINNTESLTNLPDIVRYGADWFRSVGTDQQPGHEAGLPGRRGASPGPVRGRRSACRCGPSSTTTAAAPAGDDRRGADRRPVGSILPPTLLDTPFDVQPLQAVGGVLGAGGIVPLLDDQCPVAAVREMVAYNSRESCGKCTPCREGTVRLLDDVRRRCARTRPATPLRSRVERRASVCLAVRPRPDDAEPGAGVAEAFPGTS